MIIDMDKTVSMTEANQNFSKVARMAMKYGKQQGFSNCPLCSAG